MTEPMAQLMPQPMAMAARGYQIMPLKEEHEQEDMQAILEEATASRPQPRGAPDIDTTQPGPYAVQERDGSPGGRTMHDLSRRNFGSAEEPPPVPWTVPKGAGPPAQDRKLRKLGE